MRAFLNFHWCVSLHMGGKRNFPVRKVTIGVSLDTMGKITTDVVDYWEIE